MELGLNQTVRSFMSRICGRSTHWAAENCYSLLCKFCPLSSSPLLFANAWNSELELEEEGEGQIISDSTFSMGAKLKVGYFAHCDVETVKRTNWKKREERFTRQFHLSALFFATRNFIAMAAGGHENEMEERRSTMKKSKHTLKSFRERDAGWRHSRVRAVSGVSHK